MGVFDGEGCVSCYFHRGKWILTLTATIANEEITELFRTTWGGGVHVRKRPTAGGLTLRQWYISAVKAIPFLEYAVVNSLHRRRRFEIALELAQSMARYADPAVRRGHNIHAGGRVITPDDLAHREALVLELRALNGGRSRFDPTFDRPTQERAAAERVPVPTREQLEDLYVQQGLTIREIAVALGFGEQGQGRIRGYLFHHQIPRRSPGNRGARGKSWNLSA